ncbi:MAG: EamA family transporter [Ignavibacteriales bacterium]|nr:MAG: EamA family transporter [Ignavibacteriaceae bacterium]MBW7873478.1 EamA family transporter [Ignavibacteria bacterium]MCZ2142169.1 EamA family transporter [Ignavibacteriales bacterium]OQY74423.1 MAG: hypothetical protein B6D45_06975 [Ignavibacteriales bacterium UTCHB3]MBV6444905.1 hypothetical protein [Ignavibacteriaceae bacterium]
MIWFILALTSAVLSSAAAITQKKALERIDALSFSFFLSIVNLLICLLFLADADLSAINFHQTWVMFVKTLLQAFAFWCVMLSLKNLEISSALPLLALTPGTVAVFAFLFIGETLTLIETIGLVMLLAGSYFIEMKTFQNMIEPFRVFFRTKKYIHVAAALAFFTISSILDKYLLKDQKMETSSFMILQHLFFAVDFAILVLVTRTKFHRLPSDILKPLVLLIVITSIITIGYRYTQILAFAIAPVALVLAIKRLSVFFASIVGGKLFNEGGLIKKGIAALIIVIGTILMIGSTGLEKFLSAINPFS